MFTSFIHWAQLNNHSQLSLYIMKQNTVRSIQKYIINNFIIIFIQKMQSKSSDLMRLCCLQKNAPLRVFCLIIA